MKERAKETELFKILSHNTAETESAGALLASVVQGDDFIALYGELGAGKTAFVRGFVRVLAPEENVSSPSYAIINEYNGKKNRIVHADVYRITSDDDLYSSGFYDYENCITLVEWCEKTPQILPRVYYKVRIDVIDESSRMIFISKVTR